jgi:biopolymer transport protein ExbD
MTAMCDVAFLLLSFFILATKFKPAEALTVNTPNSVNTKPAPEKNVVLLTIDKDGKVYFSMSEKDRKETALAFIESTKGVKLSQEAKVNYLKESSFVGVPLNQLNSYFSKSPDEVKTMKLEGIPAKDSTNNEIIDWVRAALEAYRGEKGMNLLVKGDNNSKFPSFQSVLYAFKKNDQLKFQMVTNPEGAPEGTELWKQRQKGQNLDN